MKKYNAYADGDKEVKHLILVLLKSLFFKQKGRCAVIGIWFQQLTNNKPINKVFPPQ